MSRQQTGTRPQPRHGARVPGGAPETPAGGAARTMLPDGALPKPRLRGWLHQCFAPMVLVAGTCLVVGGSTLALRAACAVYMLAALLLFTNSAFYHRGTWSPRAHEVFRRVDHANIFVFIAGSYTPLAVAMLHGGSLRLLLGLVWSCALVGVLFRVLWINAPRWLYVALYVLLGWAAVGWMGTFWHVGGPAVVSLVVAGGVVYSAGALFYGLKRPNPWPETWGFHEFFHACTVLAAICHYVAIALLVLR